MVFNKSGLVKRITMNNHFLKCPENVRLYFCALYMYQMSWKLKPKREFGWKMKPLESAKTNFITDKHGVFRLHIEHDIIRQVTPEMLYWWFSHIGGSMVYQGKSYPRYLVWHPTDHIHWELAKPDPNGGASQGASFRIVEAFGADMTCLVDSVEYVEKLDITGIRLVRKIAGVEVFSLQHDFEPHKNGTKYTSNMVVGTTKPIAATVFNQLIRPFIFTEKMGYAWLKHNIEEVGNFEYFLPEHYAECVKKKEAGF